MKFGSVDINTTDVDFTTWTWNDFLKFYESGLKGQIEESPEEVAKVLGVKIPVQKPKPETA
jgi:hypothetical protein